MPCRPRTCSAFHTLTMLHRSFRLATGLAVLAVLSALPAAAQTTFGPRATFEFGLGSPQSMTELSDGTILVTERTNGRVTAFGSSRTTFAIGLQTPQGVTELASSGTILIVENGASRVSAFAAGGGTRTDFATGLTDPLGVTQLADGTVLVTERSAGRIAAFTSAGVPLPAFATGLQGPRSVTELPRRPRACGRANRQPRLGLYADRAGCLRPTCGLCDGAVASARCGRSL